MSSLTSQPKAPEHKQLQEQELRHLLPAAEKIDSMNSRNIHFLKNDAQKDIAPTRSRALEHLDAAHAKLVQLQAWRRQFKIDYAECVKQRDAARRELVDFKCIANRKSEALQEYDTILAAQTQLIQDLRDECSTLQERHPRPARDVDPESNGPALTALALDRYEEQESIADQERDMADADHDPNRSAGLLGRIRSLLMSSSR